MLPRDLEIKNLITLLYLASLCGTSFTQNETVPVFRQESDGPHDVNVTDGDSVTFNCSAFAKPEATVVWFWNGSLIDANNPPKRLVFSSDNKSLTIRDVCRDCVDRESKTDLMVIQCNASNVHGYAFAQGYLNVLTKTRVTIRGTRNVTVDFLEEKEFVFQCLVTSDPSTPATVRWYKTEPYNDLVRDEKPYICVGVTKGSLIITIDPKCSVDCAKYLGEYRCIGDNGYSQETQTITVSYRYRPPTEGRNETCALWKITLTAIGFVLFLIGVFLGFHSKRCCAINGRKKEDRRVSNVDSIYDRIRYDSVGIPLEGMGDNGRSMRRVYSMYDQTGYDSIDQVLEYMARREAAWPKLSDANPYDGYESIHVHVNGARREAMNIDKTMLVEDTKYDNMKITVESITDAGGKINENRVDGCESTRFESRRIPNLSEQSEAMNAVYADLSRQEINSYLDLVGPSEDHHYLELCSKEVKPCLDMGQNEVDIDKKEMDPNFCIVSDPILPPTTTAVHKTDYLVLKN